MLDTVLTGMTVKIAIKYLWENTEPAKYCAKIYVEKTLSRSNFSTLFLQMTSGIKRTMKSSNFC